MDINLNSQNTQNINSVVNAREPEQVASNEQDQQSITTSDKVTISKEGQALSEDNNKETTDSSEELSPEEIEEVDELKARDTEVRTHEQAHLAAAGGYATGGASYTMETGPDGQQYAVGGNVGIDLSEADTPEETVTKMQTVQQAALAPAEPSSTDRQVASQAAAMETAARKEISESASSVPEDDKVASSDATTKEVDASDKESDDTSSNSPSKAYLAQLNYDHQEVASNALAIA